ncbi:PhzF family phenazine biosynthesis protein [Salinispora arenicola]|uniref:PhzF family phenazine biosynthesis protein n=1 Tax=Salinispora arenicola TaxID=168697 RepID=UPI0027DE7474|nr:PhzF family phenazine biosynthesis protein [Salinispora arenicola]
MAQFARWTNLSETTYVLPSAVADYRLRIFTPGGEIPFAGHPTLGSAHAWLEAGGIPHSTCSCWSADLGLVTVRRASPA